MFLLACVNDVVIRGDRNMEHDCHGLCGNCKMQILNERRISQAVVGESFCWIERHRTNEDSRYQPKSAELQNVFVHGFGNDVGLCLASVIVAWGRREDRFFGGDRSMLILNSGGMKIVE